MKAHLILGFLAVAAGCAGVGHIAATVEPAGRSDWRLAKADADKWAGRVRALLPAGWAVTVSGNDVVVGRDRPVRFAQRFANEPARAKGEVAPDPKLRDAAFRLTLRFGPKVPFDEYERLAASNAASQLERERLERTLVGISHKFGEYLPETPEEKERVRAYQEAVDKLPRHTLPELYTQEFSIFLFVPYDVWSHVYDRREAAECRQVEESLLKFFGMYDPAATRTGERVGRPEPAGPPS